MSKKTPTPPKYADPQLNSPAAAPPADDSMWFSVAGTELADALISGASESEVMRQVALIREARVRERERTHRATIMQSLARQIGDAAYSGHSLTVLLNRLKYCRLQQRTGSAPAHLLGGQSPDSVA